MAAMSNYLEAALLNHLFRGTAFSQPADIYIALCTAAPSDTSTGSTLTETSGTGYARLQVGRGNGIWDAPGTNGTTQNTAAISFPAAGGNWSGPITHIALVDAATNGNVLFYGALSTGKTITSGDVFQFDIGQLAIQIDN